MEKQLLDWTNFGESEYNSLKAAAKEHKEISGDTYVLLPNLDSLKDLISDEDAIWATKYYPTLGHGKTFSEYFKHYIYNHYAGSNESGAWKIERICDDSIMSQLYERADSEMKEYLKNITESDRVTDVLKKHGLKIEIPFKKALNKTEMFLILGLKYKALTITIHCAPQ